MPIVQVMLTEQEIDFLRRKQNEYYYPHKEDVLRQIVRYAMEHPEILMKEKT